MFPINFKNNECLCPTPTCHQKITKDTFTHFAFMFIQVAVILTMVTFFDKIIVIEDPGILAAAIALIYLIFTVIIGAMVCIAIMPCFVKFKKTSNH
jgi:hypothetical protein